MSQQTDSNDADLAQRVEAVLSNGGKTNHASTPAPPPQAAQRTAATIVQPWSPELVTYLTTSMLVFGILVLAMMTFLLMKSKPARAILSSFGIVLVVIAGVVVTLVGYSEVQVASVIGLLGTIAGYLLGQESRVQRSDAIAPSGVHSPPAAEE